MTATRGRWGCFVAAFIVVSAGVVWIVSAVNDSLIALIFACTGAGMASVY